MNDKKLKVIAEFGRKYQNIYLYNQKKKEDLQNLLKNDWLEALKFFFSRSFMRGRRDEISVAFLNKAIKVLDDFNLKDNLAKFNQDENWRETLQNKLQEEGVNNRYDRGMLLTTIEFILKLDNYNLINYSLQTIEKHGIEKIYSELDNLTAVGDKIASFFLRDLVCIFDLKLQNNKQIFLQPIAQKSDIDKAISGNKNSLNIVREAIIKVCDDAKISSIEFNQGAWYIGFHSFEIMLENLDKFIKE
jgi:predicted house-cleaning noncanonical NTP pyrophosphatase (MazG superfamily)